MALRQEYLNLHVRQLTEGTFRFKIVFNTNGDPIANILGTTPSVAVLTDLQAQAANADDAFEAVLDLQGNVHEEFVLAGRTCNEGKASRVEVASATCWRP